MGGIRVTGETFGEDSALDVDQRLARGLGAFLDEPAEDVSLCFDREDAQRVRERVWHGTERKEDLPDGGLLLRLRVPVNSTLIRLVLGFGAGVEVLAPDRLRRQVADIHRRAAAAYGPCAAGSGLRC
jgi:proteasome accessory factor B